MKTITLVAEDAERLPVREPSVLDRPIGSLVLNPPGDQLDGTQAALGEYDNNPDHYFPKTQPTGDYFRDQALLSSRHIAWVSSSVDSRRAGLQDARRTAAHL